MEKDIVARLREFMDMKLSPARWTLDVSHLSTCIVCGEER